MTWRPSSSDRASLSNTRAWPRTSCRQAIDGSSSDPNRRMRKDVTTRSLLALPAGAGAAVRFSQRRSAGQVAGVGAELRVLEAGVCLVARVGRLLDAGAVACCGLVHRIDQPVAGVACTDHQDHAGAVACADEHVLGP